MKELSQRLGTDKGKLKPHGFRGNPNASIYFMAAKQRRSIARALEVYGIKHRPGPLGVIDREWISTARIRREVDGKD